MSEKDYSNREIDASFREIKNLLIEIRDQTVKTNGRVSKLELWKEGLMGKFTIIGIVLSGAWALLLTFGKNLFY